MAIVIRYMYCLVFISRSSDLIQYGGIVTKANRILNTMRYLHCALSCGAAFCNRTCLWQAGGRAVWLCYHDNSKLRASILTKLGFLRKGSDYL